MIDNNLFDFEDVRRKNKAARLEITYEDLADFIESNPLKETPSDTRNIETTIQFLCYLGYMNYVLMTPNDEYPLQEIYDFIHEIKSMNH